MPFLKDKKARRTCAGLKMPMAIAHPIAKEWFFYNLKYLFFKLFIDKGADFFKHLLGIVFRSIKNDCVGRRF